MSSKDARNLRTEIEAELLRLRTARMELDRAIDHFEGVSQFYASDPERVEIDISNLPQILQQPLTNAKKSPSQAQINAAAKARKARAAKRAETPAAKEETRLQKKREYNAKWRAAQRAEANQTRPVSETVSDDVILACVKENDGHANGRIICDTLQKLNIEIPKTYRDSGVYTKLSLLKRHGVLIKKKEGYAINPKHQETVQ